MRVITVDDEKMSLMKMERILRDISGVTFVAGYKSPAQALEHQREDAADIAFLDVEMPEMDGLTLSERLMELNPGLEIVFVTAHDKYALAAYQTNAIGYLLKPVQADDVQAQINRVQRYQRPKTEQPGFLYCKTFGAFYVKNEYRETEIMKFRTEKSEELLAFLLSQRGKPVSRDVLCDTLWPDMEIDKATRNFHTTAYNIRHSFHMAGFADVLLRTHDSYRINSACIKSDLDIFDLAERAQTKEECLRAMESAADAYDGPYLFNKDYIWVSDYRFYYEQAFERYALCLCNAYMQQRLYEKTQNILTRLLCQNPSSEEAGKLQFRVLSDLGREKEARQFKEKFINKYISDMGIPPAANLFNIR